ncbi:hypothetical protein [Hyphomicrobium sulfonivorans]|uniref:hypothetical protein n=1 Tax=Hyphomicrobium sulfonivorans TaxID=121290 RepID=UPI0012ECFF43|nr:hypothetical protein [Hyphomicrobium sulfonivorans]
MNDNITGTIAPAPKGKPRKAKATAPKRTKHAPKAVPPSTAEIDAARDAAIRQELLHRDANAWREYLGKSPRIECHLYRIECIARLVDDIMMLRGVGARNHDIQDKTLALIGDLLQETRDALWNGLELMDCNAFNQPAPAWLPSHRPATIPAPPAGRA